MKKNALQNLIKKYMAEKQITRDDLAALIGISEKSLYNYYVVGDMPSRTATDKIEKFFYIKIHKLIKIVQ